MLLLSGSLVATPISSLAQSGAEDPPQTPPPIVTDRPTTSLSPLVVPRRSVQVELGALFQRIDEDAGPTDVQILPDLVIRYGIIEKLEIRLYAAGWTIERSAVGRETGFSDVALGTKIALARQQGARPDMGLVVGVSMPVGADEISGEATIPTVLFLGANDLSDRVAIAYNFGPSVILSDSDGDRERSADLNYSVVVTGSVGRGVNLFGELFGVYPLTSDLPDRDGFQLGATVLPRRRFQIDFRGGIGRIDGHPSWRAGVGLAFRVP